MNLKKNIRNFDFLKIEDYNVYNINRRKEQKEGNKVNEL